MADDVDIVSDIQEGELDAAAPPPAGTVPAQGADAVQAGARPAKEIVTQEPPSKDKPASLRDQLSAAFKDEGGDPAAQADAASAGDRPRRADGTFKSAEEIAAEAAAAPPAGQEPPQAIQPPQFLNAAEVQQFTALPPEMQQFVARTTAVVEQAAARYAGYEQIEQMIGPRRQAWAVNGLTEGQALNQLFAVSDFATQRPRDFVLWFAGQQGIDLGAIAEGGDDGDIDPHVLELRQQVANLTGQLSGITQASSSAAHNGVVNEVQQFAAEAGTDGQPLRPHFAELGGGVIPYIQQVMAENPALSRKDVLSEAYERACWGTPTVRAKMLAAQEATRLAGQRENAARAQAASGSVTGQAPVQGSQAPKDIGSGSVRDTLVAAFEQHSV